MNKTINDKTKTYLVGALVGALTGVVAAAILIQSAEKEQTKPRLTAGQGVQIGLGLLGVLRLMTGFVSGK